MHDCCPLHLSMGAARMKADKKQRMIEGEENVERSKVGTKEKIPEGLTDSSGGSVSPGLSVWRK